MKRLLLVALVCSAAAFSGCGLISVKSSVSAGIANDNAGPAPSGAPTFRIETMADASKTADKLRSGYVGKTLYVKAMNHAREGVLREVNGNLIVLKLNNGHEYRSELENITDVWIIN